MQVQYPFYEAKEMALMCVKHLMKTSELQFIQNYNDENRKAPLLKPYFSLLQPNKLNTLKLQYPQHTHTHTCHCNNGTPPPPNTLSR